MFFKIISIVSDSGANFKSAISMFVNIEKIPCAGHRLNLSVNDIFKIIKITEKTGNYFIYEYNVDGDLRKIEITSERKKCIEILNAIKVQINETLTKCKHLVGSFRHSDGLLRRLKEKQRQLDYDVKIKLVQNVSTRWNSTLDMVDSILTNKDAICSMALDPINSCIKDYVPLETEFSLLDELSILLQPLQELTKVFSGRMYVTSTILYPSIHWLMNTSLLDISLDSHELIEIRQDLITSLNKRFKYVFDNDLFLAATFLNYKYRKFEFIIDASDRFIKINQAKNYIISFYEKNRQKNLTASSSSSISQEITEISSAQTPLASSTPFLDVSNLTQRISSSTRILVAAETTPSLPKKSNKRKFQTKSILEKIADRSEKIVSNQSVIEIEIDQYQNHIVSTETETDHYDSALWFFKHNLILYPKLSEIGKVIFSIPCTSVPSESLFSQAGIIQNDLRNRLNPVNLEALNFLKHNSMYF